MLVKYVPLLSPAVISEEYKEDSRLLFLRSTITFIACLAIAAVTSYRRPVASYIISLIWLPITIIDYYRSSSAVEKLALENFINERIPDRKAIRMIVTNHSTLQKVCRQGGEILYKNGRTGLLFHILDLEDFDAFKMLLASGFNMERNANYLRFVVKNIDLKFLQYLAQIDAIDPGSYLPMGKASIWRAVANKEVGDQLTAIGFDVNADNGLALHGLLSDLEFTEENVHEKIQLSRQVGILLECGANSQIIVQHEGQDISLLELARQINPELSRVMENYI